LVAHFCLKALNSQCLTRTLFNHDMLSWSSASVVNTLLTELDRLDARRGVFVLAATNRPDMLDLAMCCPWRLDKLLYVDLPAPDKRAEIVRTLLIRRHVLLAPIAGAYASAMDHVAEIIAKRSKGVQQGRFGNWSCARPARAGHAGRVGCGQPRS
jgi:SpoVK/Ycf46/Vps4 family AAA+-type ATPase